MLLDRKKKVWLLFLQIFWCKKWLNPKWKILIKDYWLNDRQGLGTPTTYKVNVMLLYCKNIYFTIMYWSQCMFHSFLAHICAKENHWEHPAKKQKSFRKNVCCKWNARIFAWIAEQINFSFIDGQTCTIAHLYFYSFLCLLSHIRN